MLCYLFMVNFDRYNESYNPSGRICVPIKTKNVNLCVFQYDNKNR